MLLEVVVRLQLEQVLAVIFDIQPSHLRVEAMIVILIFPLYFLYLSFIINIQSLRWPEDESLPLIFLLLVALIVLLLDERFDDVLVLIGVLIELIALLIELFSDEIDFFTAIELEFVGVKVVLADPWMVEHLFDLYTFGFVLFEHTSYQRDTWLGDILFLKEDVTKDDLMVQFIPIRLVRFLSSLNAI